MQFSDYGLMNLLVVFNIFSLLKEQILRPLVNLDHLAAQLTDLRSFNRGLCPTVVTFF